MSKVLYIPVIIAFVLYYLHEYHKAEFIQVSRRIPYLKEFVVSIHSIFESESKPKDEKGNLSVFTEEDLKKYIGDASSEGLYISILGRVYDVLKGRKHYGPNGGYHTFAGRDNSNAFVTGQFDNCSDDVLALTLDEMLGVFEWVSFYDKEYTYKGTLVGRFYTEKGEKTEYHKVFDKKIDEAKRKKGDKKTEEMHFPPCNVEWNKDEGTTVWCTSKSGGVHRSWAGVPRKLYNVGAETFRCACINLDDLSNPESPQYSRRGHLEEYLACQTTATSCVITE